MYFLTFTNETLHIVICFRQLDIKGRLLRTFHVHMYTVSHHVRANNTVTQFI